MVLELTDDHAHLVSPEVALGRQDLSNTEVNNSLTEGHRRKATVNLPVTTQSFLMRCK